MSQDIIHVENITLPNGDIYIGEAIPKYGGQIEITGYGKSRHLDGSTYEGQWFDGIPCGYGVYTFMDGDFHKGFFYDTPHGAGYLCLNTKRSMHLGFYQHGILDGWAIAIGPNGMFDCSFLAKGKVVQNHTEDFRWMFNMLNEIVFTHYSGNKIQCYKEEGCIRFGVPKRISQKDNVTIERLPIGFLFDSLGNLYIGAVEDFKNLNGFLIKCTRDHRILAGSWMKNAVKREMTIADIKKWSQILEGHGLKRESIVKSNDDLPF